MYELVPADESLKETERKKRTAIRWYMYFCSCSTSILSLTVGSTIVWTSPVIIKLRSSDPDINPLGAPVTSLQISLLATIPTIGNLIGPLVFSRISDTIGRKRTLIYSAPIEILLLIIIAFIGNIHVYYVCWAFFGMIRLGTSMNCYIYNSEIAEDCNRGKTGLLLNAGYLGGIIYGYGFGSIASVKTYTLICSIPLMIFLILSILMVESPVFLISKGMTSQCRNALQKLRLNPREDIESEIEDIKEVLRNKNEHSSMQFLQLFKSRGARRASLISIVLCFTQQCCGSSVVIHFIGPMFEATGVAVSGHTVSIIVGVVQLIAVLVTICIVERIGKRNLILVSCVTCSITMFFLAWYFYLKRTDSPLITEIQWISILFAVLYIIGYALGLGTLPVTFIGELFCTDLRALGIGISLSLEVILSFFLLFSYPLVSDNYGEYVCMWFYSASTCAGAIILYFIIPDTTGKSLGEIQILLNT